MPQTPHHSFPSLARPVLRTRLPPRAASAGRVRTQRPDEGGREEAQRLGSLTPGARSWKAKLWGRGPVRVPCMAAMAGSLYIITPP